MESDESSPSEEDRRRFPRLRNSCKIRVRRVEGAMQPTAGVEAMTVNISGGGVCYLSDVPVPPGDFLAVELSLQEFGSPVVALARAVFCDERNDGFEVGMEFWWVGWGDDTAQREIADFIKTRLDQGPA